MNNKINMNTQTTRKSSSVYSKLVTFFLFLTVAAIFVVTHFALAKVHIKIYSDLESKEDSVLVEMQSEGQEELSADALIGKIITNEMELEATVDSSQENTTSDRAGGYVFIYNNYSKNQPLIKTTRLLTPDNKLFRITEGVTVPAGDQVKVWAEADQDGEEFVTEATTFILPGLWEGLQDKIYAESLDGMKLQSVPGFLVTEENIKEAKEKIKAEAIEKSISLVNEMVSKDLAIDEKRLKLEFEDLESNQVGDISSETTVKQKVTSHALVFDKNTLAKIAEEKFSKEIEGNQKLLDFDKEKINYEILEINLDKQEAILEIKTEITTSSTENKWDIDKQELIGLDEAGLRNYFKEFNPEKVEIKFSPFWVKSVPRLKDHIIIE